MIQDLVRKLTNGKEPHKGVNPDEGVAIGAALQGGVLGGDVKDILLLDVTPLSLGVETLGGVMTPVIERNTTIPVKKSQIFSTAEDGQTAVTIHVLQGERPLAGDNVSLGMFNLEGLPPAPRGLPQVEVTFDIDANGILHVSAKDKATAREQSIRITASTNLKKDDVERMVREAERNAATDKRRKELVEARNNADALIYTVEKALRDLGDKVPGQDRRRIEEQVTALRKLKEGEDTAAIRQASEQLQQASYALSQQMYSQPAGGPSNGYGAHGPNGSSQGGQRSDEDVVEGEFRPV